MRLSAPARPWGVLPAGPHWTIDDGLPTSTADAPLATLPGFTLSGAWPNPATTRALAIRFALPDAAPARLALIDVAGREVAARDVGALGAGWHVLDLATGAHVHAGLYFVRLVHGGAAKTARVTVLQ